MQYTRENILGVEVSAIHMQQAIQQIIAWVEQHVSAYVCVTPAHAVMDCVANPEIKRIYNQSGMTTPDGMAIVWLLKLAGHKQVSRVYGPDLLQTLCGKSIAKPLRHYFLGGAPGVAAEMVKRLKENNPALQVAGIDAPPFRELSPAEEEQMIDKIQQSAPDILWVGLGSPRQEQWMAAQTSRMNMVMIGVGAAFDFLSGNKPQAPRWVRRMGMEWFYRLLSEPGRLWRRYIQYPRFVWLVLLQKLGLRKFSVQ